jgi:hypothetical protein
MNDKVTMWKLLCYTVTLSLVSLDDDYIKAGISFDSEKDLEYGVGIDRNTLPGNCIKMAARQCWPAIGKSGTLPQKGQMLGKELIAKDRVPASCTPVNHWE